MNDMGILERKEKQREEIRKMILEASMQLFVKEGFENVSIRKIADLIEYSPTTLYIYFKDKNEILFHLCEMGFEQMIASNLALVQIESPIDRLYLLGENYINFGLENPEYYDLMFIQNAPMKTIREQNLGHWPNGDIALETLKLIIQECMDKKLIPTGDVATISMAVWAVAHGLVSLAIRQRLERLVEPDKVVQSMHESIRWMINTLKKA